LSSGAPWATSSNATSIAPELVAAVAAPVAVADAAQPLSTTMDPAPPPMEYIASSGGIFRDCAVHDFDVPRWITGQQAVEEYGAPLPIDATDAVENMAYVDAAHRAAGMSPR
jgi:predicted dehydrogenase